MPTNASRFSIPVAATACVIARPILARGNIARTTAVLDGRRALWAAIMTIAASSDTPLARNARGNCMPDVSASDEDRKNWKFSLSEWGWKLSGRTAKNVTANRRWGKLQHIPRKLSAALGQFYARSTAKGIFAFFEICNANTTGEDPGFGTQQRQPPARQTRYIHNGKNKW